MTEPTLPRQFTYVDTLCYYDGPQLVQFKVGDKDYLAVAVPANEQTEGMVWPMVAVPVDTNTLASAIEDWSETDLRSPFVNAPEAFLLDVDVNASGTPLPLPLSEDWMPRS